MRIGSTLVSVLCIYAAMLVAPAPAKAHMDRDGQDPYAYRYEPRGYYPYYNSNHWRPAAELRLRRACCRPAPVLPPYYAAWGYPGRYHVRRSRHLWHR